MSGDSFANAIQVIATLIALVGLAVSFEFSRRGQKLQKEQSAADAASAAESNRQAQAAAQRAAAASALTIDELTRMADALDRLGDRAGAGAGLGFDDVRERMPGLGARATGAHIAPPADGRVRWSLVAVSTGAFVLTNTAEGIAHGVEVRGDATLDGPHEVGDGTAVGPGAAVGFIARILPTTTDATITVTWADESGHRSMWRYPLPV